MAYSAVPTVVTGQLWTASDHNTYIRDNFAAGVPGILTAKGDLPVASAVRAAGVLPIGAEGQSLVVDPTKPLGVKWGGGMNLLSEQVMADSLQSAVDFLAIPQTYRHLRLLIQGRQTNYVPVPTGIPVYLRFNGDTAAHYSHRVFTTTSGSATPTTAGGQGESTTEIKLGLLTGGDGPAGLSSFVEVDILNYANATWFKMVNMENHHALNYHASGAFLLTDIELSRGSGLWVSSAPITQLQVFCLGVNFLAGSLLSLYGIS